MFTSANDTAVVVVVVLSFCVLASYWLDGCIDTIIWISNTFTTIDNVYFIFSHLHISMYVCVYYTASKLQTMDR